MSNSKEPSKPLLSLSQVAELLGVSPEHVKHLIDRGLLKAINLGPNKNKLLRIKPEWVDDLIEARELPATKPKVVRKNGNLRPSKFFPVGKDA